LFFWKDSKNTGNKSKNKQIALYQIKILCSAKETTNRVKRQLTEWEKAFGNYAFDKGLIFRVYEELQKVNSQKPNKPILKNAQ
jgi:hypothetical protein